MHPEISLVLLTVLAGAGQGLFIFTVVLDSLYYGTGSLPAEYLFAGSIVSLILQTAGIAASTSHLGNPGRGWRAVLMVKNSWLSREVITLSLSVGLAVLYALSLYFGLPREARLLIGLAGMAANAGFYLSSAMVYASVSFVREWANAYTPFAFLVLGITSGIAVGLPLLHYTGADGRVVNGTQLVLIALGVMSFAIKELAYMFNARAYVSVNIKNAVGINDREITLMDMGTSYAHYNTREYFHPFSEQCNRRSKMLVMTTAFIIPVLLWVLSSSGLAGPFSAALSTAAAAFMMTGLVTERRLFFIQGNNIQNLYYANFRSTGAKNPLESRARKGSPVPVWIHHD